MFSHPATKTTNNITNTSIGAGTNTDTYAGIWFHRGAKDIL